MDSDSESCLSAGIIDLSQLSKWSTGTPTGLGNFLHATGDTGISSGPSYSKEKTKFSDSKQFELSEANQSAKESTNVEPEVRGELQSVSHDTGSPSKEWTLPGDDSFDLLDPAFPAPETLLNLSLDSTHESDPPSSPCVADHDARSKTETVKDILQRLRHGCRSRLVDQYYKDSEETDGNGEDDKKITEFDSISEKGDEQGDLEEDERNDLNCTHSIIASPRSTQVSPSLTGCTREERDHMASQIVDHMLIDLTGDFTCPSHCETTASLNMTVSLLDEPLVSVATTTSAANTGPPSKLPVIKKLPSNDQLHKITAESSDYAIMKETWKQGYLPSHHHGNLKVSLSDSNLTMEGGGGDGDTFIKDNNSTTSTEEETSHNRTRTLEDGNGGVAELPIVLSCDHVTKTKSTNQINRKSLLVQSRLKPPVPPVHPQEVTEDKTGSNTGPTRALPVKPNTRTVTPLPQADGEESAKSIPLWPASTPLQCHSTPITDKTARKNEANPSFSLSSIKGQPDHSHLTSSRTLGKPGAACVGGKQLPKRKGRLVEVGASPKLLPAAENRPALRKSLPVAPGSKRKALYDRNAKQSNPTKLAGPVKAVNLHQLKPPAKDVEKTALKKKPSRKSLLVQPAVRVKPLK